MPNPQTNGAALRGPVEISKTGPTQRQDPSILGLTASDPNAKQGEAPSPSGSAAGERHGLDTKVRFYRSEMFNLADRLAHKEAEVARLHSDNFAAHETNYRLERELSQAHATMSALHDSIADRDRTIEALKAKRRKR